MIYKITQAEHIDPVVEANPNYISSIGIATPLHCHDFYEFFLITRGSCIHRVNGRSQRLKEGDLVFIRPDDSHFYEYDNGADCSFINIACSRSVTEDAFSYLGAGPPASGPAGGGLPPSVPLGEAEKEDFIADFERLKAFSTINKKQANVYLRKFLVNLICRYFQNSGSGAAGSLPLWFESLLTQMQKRENFSAGTTRLYDLAGRSKGHVDRAFRRYTGKTPTSYVNSLRLQYVKSLLQLTSLNITDAAMDAGFGNLSHFNHLFKKQFGTAPSGFRKKRA